MATNSLTAKSLDLSLVVLGPERLNALQTLFEACGDYFEGVYGHAVRPNEAAERLYALPAATRAEDKRAFGLLGPEGELVGYAELIGGYPVPDACCLGFLLLLPALRGRGVGEHCYQVLEQLVAARGYAQLQLGVAAHNLAGWRFWQRRGFVERGRNRVDFGGLSGTLIVMAKGLVRVTSPAAAVPKLTRAGGAWHRVKPMARLQPSRPVGRLRSQRQLPGVG